MRQPDWTTERAEVERVAEEYRGRGYQVVVCPSAAELPDFIREYPPDIVARSSSESVLIEVTHRTSSTDRNRVRAIAERVERQPGWRFVVVSPPPHGEGMPPEQLRSVQEVDVRRMLGVAEWLRSKGLREAAVLLYWAAIEAGMRLAAERHAIELPRPDTWSLMRELVSNGILHRDLYRQLSDAYRLRSALAHGFEPPEHLNFEESMAILRQTAQALMFDPERPMVDPAGPGSGTPA